MNFADPKGGLSVRDVEPTIGTGVDVVLPRADGVPAVDQPGRAAAAERPQRDPMVKELRRLVSRFSATPLMKPGRYRAKHRAESAMNLADRLAAAARPAHARRPRETASGRRRRCPVRPSPRPCPPPPVDALARAEGPRRQGAVRAAWAPG